MGNVLANLRNRLPDPSPTLSGLKPDWALVEGQGRSVRLIAGIVSVALLLISAGSIQLVLALATIGVFSVKFAVVAAHLRIPGLDVAGAHPGLGSGLFDEPGALPHCC